MAPKVSCVIINWNGDSDTVRCLDSLLKLDYDNCHVVLSDNGSRKESLQALKDWRATNLPAGRCGGISSLQICENGKNLGFTGANTVGINHALTSGADYVLFLNNDTIVTPDFLGKMVEAAESDPKVGITGCKIFFADTDQTGMHKIWSLGGYSFVGGMPLNIAEGQSDSSEWTGRKVQPLINGCCMLIKRAVIETIGVQDDRLFFGMDDVDYSLRASRKGWKNMVVYDAIIYHAASQSVVKRSSLQAYYLFRNVLLLRVSHFQWYQNIIFFIVFTLRYVALGSMYRWLTGESKANWGVYFAIRDFFSGNTGECSHTAALRGV